MSALDVTTPDVGMQNFLPLIERGKEVSRKIDGAFKNVRSRLVTTRQAPDAHPSLREQLYNARAQFKIFVSSVSMHLPRDWVSKLFAQIDSVLDAEEWDPRDPPPTLPSSMTLIRMLLTLKVERRPGLGISTKGNLVAAWTMGQNRLTVECLPADRVQWILRRERGDDIEKAAGQTKIERLSEVLAPYEPSIWFAYGE